MLDFLKIKLQHHWIYKIFKTDEETNLFSNGTGNITIDQLSQALQLRQELKRRRHVKTFGQWRGKYSCLFAPSVQDTLKMLTMCSSANAYSKAIYYAVSMGDHKLYKCIIDLARKNSISVTDKKLKVNRLGENPFTPIGFYAMEGDFRNILKFTRVHTDEELEIMIAQDFNARLEVFGCSKLDSDEFLCFWKIQQKHNLKTLKKFDDIFSSTKELTKFWRWRERKVKKSEQNNLINELRDLSRLFNTTSHSSDFKNYIFKTVTEYQRDAINAALGITLEEPIEPSTEPKLKRKM